MAFTDRPTDQLTPHYLPPYPSLHPSIHIDNDNQAFPEYVAHFFAPHQLLRIRSARCWQLQGGPAKNGGVAPGGFDLSVRKDWLRYQTEGSQGVLSVSPSLEQTNCLTPRDVAQCSPLHHIGRSVTYFTCLACLLACLPACFLPSLLT